MSIKMTEKLCSELVTRLINALNISLHRNKARQPGGQVKCPQRADHTEQTETSTCEHSEVTNTAISQARKEERH